jgi:AraC family transcriptional regulator
MRVLSKGKSTGKIINSVNSDGVIIMTAQYSIEECNYGMHYHENPQICFLFQGMDIESRNNLLYERKPGDVYFYHAGEKHGAISRQSISKNTVIEFGKTFLGKYEVAESQIEMAVKDNLDTKFLILKMQQEMLIADSSSQLATQTLLLDLISSSKYLYNQSPPKWVRLLVDLLNDRWNEQVTLNELSMATATHPATISKHFRKYFSCTLGEYLRKLKIDKSIPLIKNSGMSLTDIAYHCGFTDQSHFTKNFKQMTGFLPKEFRNI